MSGTARAEARKSYAETAPAPTKSEDKQANGPPSMRAVDALRR